MRRDAYDFGGNLRMLYIMEDGAGERDTLERRFNHAVGRTPALPLEHYRKS